MGMPDLVAEVVGRQITITDRFEGFHRWLHAPEEVKFLRAFHRHLFQVAVTIRVGHGDRQVEFFTAKRTLTTVIANRFKGKEFDKSCEDLAEAIGMDMVFNGYSVVGVEVSEDGENSGSVEFEVRARASGQPKAYMHFQERRENPGVPIPGTESFSDGPEMKHSDDSLDEFEAYLQQGKETPPPVKNDEDHPGI